MEELPQHRPGHRDPICVCHQMAASGIVLLCLGCNETTEHSRAFFMGLSLITGGRFIAVRHVNRLPQVIIDHFETIRKRFFSFSIYSL